MVKITCCQILSECVGRATNQLLLVGVLVANEN